MRDKPHYDARVYGAVVVLKWIEEMLVIGTAYGYLKVWAQHNGVGVLVS
jgi:hypothetical protein